MNLNILYFLQVVLAVTLIGLILLQSKGTGLGSTFGGDLGSYSSRRGVEKMLFVVTIIVSFVFLILSLIRLLV